MTTFRPKTPRTCSSARRMVAVEATILGRAPWRRMTTSNAASYRPDDGAERAGYKVQLILDDE